MIRPGKFSLLVVIVLMGTLLLEAQRRGFGLAPTAFQKEDPTRDFAIVRWYSSGWEGDGWAHDYPNAEEHILQIMKEVSLIDTDRLSYKVVDLASPEIFKYPFAYVSHPGEVFPSKEEIENLRQYIERGGFIMFDDFGGQGQGPWEMENFREVLRRAFPDREMYPLTVNHELLRISYVIDDLNMEHPMSYAKSFFYGFNDSHGRLAMVICHANDVGDYWEFIDSPRYKLKPSAEALKLGVNIALYTLTH
ncbi:MAG TPA: DUF4159 domain-containing protein [Terriglobia bacterium]|nr:DUF4159 domain-containing protein [Terriglobia bacterium]